ncbi:MAG TPA: response regulator [Paludibacteraceae bacterium]|nr:response regulator [Paludibacteraceae bacterium]HPT43607.1 response regulator [Paludibacteraceae bacterium]
MKKKIKIFLVDDDVVFLRLLEIQFNESGDFEIETYSTGELCVENLSHKPDVIILDYLLDGVVRDVMNGIETLDKIKAYDTNIPVIILSAQDKIDVAINCMHHAAFDYVVKSETSFLRLQKIITTIFETSKLKKQLNWYMERM